MARPVASAASKQNQTRDEDPTAAGGGGGESQSSHVGKGGGAAKRKDMGRHLLYGDVAIKPRHLLDFVTLTRSRHAFGAGSADRHRDTPPLLPPTFEEILRKRLVAMKHVGVPLSPLYDDLMKGTRRTRRRERRCGLRASAGCRPCRALAGVVGCACHRQDICTHEDRPQHDGLHDAHKEGRDLRRDITRMQQ